MKVLLTGASGFVGRNFLESAPEDMEIIGIYNSSTDIVNFVKEKDLKNVTLHQCDLSEEKQVQELFKKIGNNFTHCLYLAGNVNIPLSNTSPDIDLKHTVTALINVLKHTKIDRFVYLSSAAVYDGNKGAVTTETKLHPIVPYCISKLAAEGYVQHFQKTGNINSFIILRFGGAFGKYSEKKFMTKLVKEIAIENKQEIEIYGNGTNIINVMYINDTISALQKSLTSDKKNVVCNLGLENMTITETVERVAKIFNKNISIKYTPKDEKQKYIGFEIEIDFNKKFNFTPEYSFEEGIKAFAEQLK